VVFTLASLRFRAYLAPAPRREKAGLPAGPLPAGATGATTAPAAAADPAGSAASTGSAGSTGGTDPGMPR
jgi:hypothetical protein